MAVHNAGTNGHHTDQIVGVVASVNPKGIKLEGHPDWLNFSKFAPDLVPPMKGQPVAVSLDKNGFIRAIGAAENGVADAHHSPVAGRDVIISRLAVQSKAASQFAASRPELKSGDVLRIAESWEAWVAR